MKYIDSRIDKQFEQIEVILKDIKDIINQIESSKIGKILKMNPKIKFVIHTLGNRNKWVEQNKNTLSNLKVWNSIDGNNIKISKIF